MESVKHDEFKQEQQKEVGQLLASGSTYESHRLKELPSEIRQKASMRKVKETGFFVKQGQEKNARRTTAPLTMEEWKAKASSANVRNGTGWMDPESAQRLLQIKLKD
jgi:hypothetical protein